MWLDNKVGKSVLWEIKYKKKQSKNECGRGHWKWKENKQNETDEVILYNTNYWNYHDEVTSWIG